MLNTHTLYFSTMAMGDEAITTRYQFDLHRVDVDTGNISMILPPEQGGIPYFSPNGQIMAIAQPDSIFLANVDGSELREALPFDQVYTYSEQIYIPRVVPMPDASSFRVVIPPQDWLHNPAESSKLWEITLSGEPVLIHSFIQYGFSNNQLSPDGRAIGYVTKDANGISSICIGFGA